MAGKPKQKPKPKLTDKDQSERFKQTARELGIQDNSEFEQVVKKLAPLKNRTPANR